VYKEEVAEVGSTRAQCGEQRVVVILGKMKGIGLVLELFCQRSINVMLKMYL
jgi:hypothetical protein